MSRLYLVLVTIYCTCGVIATRSCFRGAVLDQVRQVDTVSITRTIELNLDLYEEAAVVAKQNGADILVYPEDGIIFSETSRNETLQYGEVLPNNPKSMCQDHYQQTHPIIYRLACAAKNNQIYLQANLIDIQPCSRNRATCPADDHFAFNTAVFFSPNGTLLAKYHKEHLFPTETFKDAPPSEELVIITTELGRFGLHTCFDLMYSSPGHKMATGRYGVDSMLFSTSWYDQVPFLDATQFQMAWANAHHVNMLAANIHLPQLGKKGSGIYVGSRESFETVNFIDGKTRLLLGNLPVNGRASSTGCPINSTIIEVKGKAPNIGPAEKTSSLKMSLNRTNVTFVRLESHSRFMKRCSGGVCCFVVYQMDRSSLVPDDQFYLILANRTKPGPFLLVEEFCAVVHCPKDLDTEEPCSNMRSFDPLRSKFHYLHLYGNFGLDTTVYASVIGSEHRVLKRDKNLWRYSSVGRPSSGKRIHSLRIGAKNRTKRSYAIGTAALYGRPYARDPPYVHQPWTIN